jgi:amino-acid N-acetyltransferase
MAMKLPEPVAWRGDEMEFIAAPPESSVKALLLESGLPATDITAEKLPTFYAYAPEGEIKGLVGLELFGTVALLRSLAVHEKSRSKGIGVQLVRHAEGVAQANGIAELYLLTTTAESFFKKIGYEKISRDLAPAAIQQTSEFVGVCPVSAAFMVKRFGR